MPGRDAYLDGLLDQSSGRCSLEGSENTMHKSLMSIVAATSIFAAAVTTSTKVEARCRGCWAGPAIANGPVTIYGYPPMYNGYAPMYYGYEPAYYYCYARTTYYGYAPRYYASRRYVCTTGQP